MTGAFCFFSCQLYCIIPKTFETPILTETRTALRTCYVSGTFEKQGPELIQIVSLGMRES